MMYESLARVYDLLSYDFDYAAWTERYERLILKKKPDAREICDAGCGTGALTLRLCEKGYTLIGVDLSGEMLSVASDKARSSGMRIPFVKQDMRSLSLPHAVDAVICACDGVNYLTRPQGVLGFFKAARENLKGGGALAFDISSRSKLITMARERLYAEETEECAYLWQNEYDEEAHILRMDLSFYIRSEDGKYERFTETHRQRAWTKAEITELLEQSGFCDIEAEGEDDGEEKRIFFSAKKA